MKDINVRQGNYFVKLVRERWWHRIFNKKFHGIHVATISMNVFVDTKGNLFVATLPISVQEGKAAVPDVKIDLAQLN